MELLASHPPVELFRASFDERPDRADRAFGETQQLISPYFIRKYEPKRRASLCPGKIGTALCKPHEFNAHGNVCVPHGAICFWYRQEQPMGLTYYPILEIRTVEPYFWWRYLSLHGFHGKFHAEFCDRDHRQHLFSMPGLPQNEWVHIAVAWDCRQGIRLYQNGRLLASSWGQDAWPAEGIHLEKIVLTCKRKSAYDELRVFSRALSDTEIRRVYDGDPIADGAPPAPPPGWRKLRRTELGWETLAELDLPELAPGTPLTAAAVPVVSAKGLKRWVWRGVDGRSGTRWPSSYQGYSYQDGGGYHLELSGKSEVNYMTISGHFQGDLFSGTSLEKPPEQERLVAIRHAGYLWRRRIEPPLSTRTLSFFRRSLEGECTGNDNSSGSVCAVKDFRARMCNLQLFSLNRGARAAAPAGGDAPLYMHVPDGFDQLRPWFAQALVSLLPERDRRAILLGPERTEASLSLPELRAVHVYTPPAKEDVFLDAVTFAWDAEARSAALLRIVAHDPVTPARELVSLDTRITGSGRFRLTLDHIDTIIPPDARMWFTLYADQPLDLRGFTVRLLRGARDKVMSEYEPRQMGMVKDIFMYMSEPRPWSYVDSREKARSLGRVYRVLGDMYEALHQLRRHTRRNGLAEGIHIWTHPEAAHPRGTARLRRDHEGAPLWAQYQRLALERLIAMPHWWIENRQAPNGEFGSNLGDDSDLVQDWPSLALVSDPDGVLRKSLHAVGNACWEAKIENGVNRRTTDPLHAYEEGLNVLPHQALLDYGNPVFLERCMLSADTVETKLMGRAPGGHLHFRSRLYGSREVITELDYGVDSTINTLLLHPAMFLAYYSRNPRAVRICSDYVRAWLEDYRANGNAWPGSIRFANHEILSEGRGTLRGYGFIYLLQAVYETTGEPLIRQALEDAGVISETKASHYGVSLLEWFDRMGVLTRNSDYLRQARGVDLGPLGTRALSDPRYDWKYAEWRITGDKDALAAAAKRLAERMSVTLPMQTEAEQSADRVQLSKKLMDRMYLGGVAAQRNELWPRHAVSYEGLSANFAALVLETGPQSLRVLLYNFDKRPQTGAIRVWQLQDGEYRVRFGPDADQDDRLDSVVWEKTLPLRRHSAVPLSLPPGQLMLIDFAQSARGEDLFSLADVAVTHLDAEYDSDRDVLRLIVHNVGSAAAERPYRNAKKHFNFALSYNPLPLPSH